MGATVTFDLKFEEFAEEAVRLASTRGLEAAAIVVADEAVRNVTRRGISESKATRRAIGKYRKLIDVSGRGENRRITAVRLPTGKGGRRVKVNRAAMIAAQDELLHGRVDPPGGHPRSRTGRLARDIGHEAPADGKVRVGVAAENPYGAIHEFGGVINHPGGTPYLRMPSGVLAFIGKAHPMSRSLPKTKPHQIRIPARPYVRPALESAKGRAFDAMITIIQRDLFGGGS